MSEAPAAEHSGAEGAAFVQTRTLRPDPDGRVLNLVRFSYLVRDHNGAVVYRGTDLGVAEAAWAVARWSKWK